MFSFIKRSTGTRPARFAAIFSGLAFAACATLLAGCPDRAASKPATESDKIAHQQKMEDSDDGTGVIGVSKLD